MLAALPLVCKETNQRSHEFGLICRFSRRGFFPLNSDDLGTAQDRHQAQIRAMVVVKLRLKATTALNAVSEMARLGSGRTD